jgi:hypothetical protein
VINIFLAPPPSTHTHWDFSAECQQGADPPLPTVLWTFKVVNTKLRIDKLEDRGKSAGILPINQRYVWKVFYCTLAMFEILCFGDGCSEMGLEKVNRFAGGIGIFLKANFENPAKVENLLNSTRFYCPKLSFFAKAWFHS